MFKFKKNVENNIIRKQFIPNADLYMCDTISITNIIITHNFMLIMPPPRLVLR